MIYEIKISFALMLGFFIGIGLGLITLVASLIVYKKYKFSFGKRLRKAAIDSLIAFIIGFMGTVVIVMVAVYTFR